MKIYLNDDTNGINIDSYNHNYQLVEGSFVERYNINIVPTENINTIISNYENVVITHFSVKKNDNTILKELTNLELKITQIDETITDDTLFVMINLNT